MQFGDLAFGFLGFGFTFVRFCFAFLDFGICNLKFVFLMVVVSGLGDTGFFVTRGKTGTY